jgi:hypothetical protein
VGAIYEENMEHHGMDGIVRIHCRGADSVTASYSSPRSGRNRGRYANRGNACVS